VGKGEGGAKEGKVFARLTGMKASRKKRRTEVRISGSQQRRIMSGRSVYLQADKGGYEGKI